MTNGERVSSRYLLDKRTHEVRRDHHVKCGEDGSQNDEFGTRQTCVNACGNEDEREPVEHVAGQKDGLPLGKAGYKEVDGEGDEHDDANLCSELGTDVYRLRWNRLGHDRVEGGRNTVDGASRDEAGASGENEEADGGHCGATNDIGEGFLLKD